MKELARRAAAKAFAEYWRDKGDEKGESQKFWLSLLTDVFGVEHAAEFISFEDQVHLDHTSFIDGYIPSTHVMIEQKSLGKDLRKAIKQSDGQMLSPFQQAKRYAADMSYEGTTYPVVYFKSDTTGEKAYEEFFVPGEKIDMQRFSALGVVEQTTRHDMTEVNCFFVKLENIFASENFTKAQVVEAIKEFIPNFEHEEKGKNLDSKM